MPLGYLAARNFEWFEGAALSLDHRNPHRGVLGTPIFALLGGIAMVAFFIDGTRPIVPLIKAYEELTSPAANLAAIPLFTLTGFFGEGGRRTPAPRCARCSGWAPAERPWRRPRLRVLHAVHGGSA